MYSLYDQFKDFHVFKKFRDLISSWWNIDIFLVEKNQKNLFLPKEINLNNKVVKSLMGSDVFRNYFLQSLKSLEKEQSFKSKEFFSIKWKQVDIDILAIPLVLGDHLEGYIVATGFLNSKKLLENLKQALSYLNLSEEDIDRHLLELKSLNDSDKVYVEKFLSILAQESFSLIQEKQRQQEIVKRIQAEKVVQDYENFVGKSPSMQFLYNILTKIKTYESSILIRGESGTGKALLAKTIHAQSPRADKPFLSQNCSSLNNTFLESELFGHKKDAFKGASQDKKGLFEMADGGTIFLNEIGDLSLNLQAKLLRVLQDGEFFSFKDTVLKKSSARLLVATNKNLEEMIKEGLFREDLFYRLNVITIKVSPLRERKEDVPLLVQHFLKEKSPLEKKQFSQKAMKYLYNYSWPGNVRELSNEIEKILLLSDHNQTLLTEATLSKKITSSEPSFSKRNSFELGNQDLKTFLRSIEKEIITDALTQERGNKTKVAKLLGSSRTSIILKVKEYNLQNLKETS